MHTIFKGMRSILAEVQLSYQLLCLVSFVVPILMQLKSFTVYVPNVLQP